MTPDHCPHCHATLDTPPGDADDGLCPDCAEIKASLADPYITWDESEWIEDVRQGNTRRGYEDWVATMIETYQDDWESRAYREPEVFTCYVLHDNQTWEQPCFYLKAPLADRWHNPETRRFVEPGILRHVESERGGFASFGLDTDPEADPEYVTVHEFDFSDNYHN